MNFAKLANLAMDCEFGNAVANLAKWFANLAMGFAKLAMRNFAKVIWQWVCEIGNGCELHSILRLLFHWSCILLLLILSSTASHFFHFSFVFPLIFGLVDG